MLGINYPELGRVELVELPEPVIEQPTDVIVRVLATTVCGSDIHLVLGHQFPQTGFTIGHEFVGEITEVGSAVVGFAVGDRVISAGGTWCGECENCRRGQPQRCLRGGGFGFGPAMGGLGGAQSEYVRVPHADQDLSRVPDGVSDAAALTVGDILATGWAAVKHSWHRPAATLLVLGCGPIGLCAVHTGKHLAGASTVIAVDTVPERLDLARRMGADHTLVSGPDTVERVLELTRGRGADSVVDAAGVQATIDMGLQAAAIGGHIAVIALAARPITLNFAEMFLKNPTLWTGLADLGNNDFLLEAIEDGVIDPTPLFTDEITLREVPDLYQRIIGGDQHDIKVLVRP